MNLKYDIYDQISLAKSEKTPFIIVESIDDRQIYDRLARQIEKNATVYQVSEFDEYTNGCTAVIDLVQKIQPDFQENAIDKYVLGIIDRDARPYKDQQDWEGVQNLQGLFILKYYSIETYFANRQSLAKMLTKITYATPQDLREELLDYFLAKEQETLPMLFYISLDALKEHCLGKEQYKAFNIYDEKESTVVDSNRFRRFEETVLPNKKADLDHFRLEKGIALEEAKLVIKGKWYLYHFVWAFYQQSTHFKDQNFPFEVNKQLFERKAQKGMLSVQVEQLYYVIMEEIDETEFSDIIERLRNLI